MFTKIVFGTDGSPGSDAAFDVVRELAVRNSATVVAVHVVELVGGKGGLYPAAANEEDIEQGVRDQIAKLAAEGVEAKLLVEHTVYGGPARLIADIAAKVDADLVVVGSRGRSPIADLLTGSVPIRLLELAKRPVLVVPGPAALA